MTDRRFRIALPLLPPLLLLSLLLSALLLVGAAPSTVPARVGVVLPLTGSQAKYAARVQSVLRLAAADLNSGALQTPGMSAPLALPAGASLQLEFADSEAGDSGAGALGALFSLNPASPVLPSFNASDPVQQSVQPLLAALGSLTSAGTEALSLGAGAMGVPVISPWTSSAAMSDPHSHPSVVRMLPSPDLLAVGLYRILVRSRWFRLSIISLDDGDSKAVTDLLLNLMAADGLVEVATYDASGARNGTVTERHSASRFEADLYSIPCSAADVDVLNTTAAAIDRAISDMLASNKVIFVTIGVPYGGAAPDSPAVRTLERLITHAHELGLMDAYAEDATLKRPNIDLIEQWLGVGWCEHEPGVVRSVVEKDPHAAHAMTGLQCVGTAIPRTTDVPAGRANAHAVQFQERLRAHDPALFPPSYELQGSDVRAYDSVVLLGAALRALYSDAAFATAPNTGESLRDALYAVVSSPEQHGLHSIDGDLLVFTAPIVDGPGGAVRSTPHSLLPLDMYNWHADWRAFRAVGVIDTVRRLANYTRTNVVMSDGSSVYTKDRESVYVDADVLPPARWDSKYIVLSYCIAVLGVWTSVILIEQGISAWARHERFKAVQWNTLAGVAITCCAVWPCYVLNLASIELDTLTVRFLPGHFIGALLFPVPFFGAIWTIGSHVEVSRRVRDGERRVVLFSGRRHGPTSGTSGNKHSSRSGGVPSVSVSGSAAHHSSLSRSLMTEVKKAAHSLREDWNAIAPFFNHVSLSAFAAVSAAVLGVLALLLEGVHTDASVSIPVANWIGAFLVLWFGWWPAGMVVFHLHKSALRYAAPFVMAGVLMAQFFVLLIPGVEWTYSTRYQSGLAEDSDDTTTLAALAATRSVYPSSSVAFSEAFALEVAAAAFFVVLVCMALNVNSLRLSKNVLDKLLAKVKSQVDSLAADLEQEQAAKRRHYDAGRFYRRNVELINLCRPVFRTYALGLALADPAVPPESLEQALGLTPDGHHAHHGQHHVDAAGDAAAAGGAKKTVHLAVPSRHSRNSSTDRQLGVGKAAAAAARASAKEKEKERSKSSHLSGVKGRAGTGAGAASERQRAVGSVKEESQSQSAAGGGGGDSKVGAGTLVGPSPPDSSPLGSPQTGAVGAKQEENKESEKSVTPNRSTNRVSGVGAVGSGGSAGTGAGSATTRIRVAAQRAKARGSATGQPGGAGASHASSASASAGTSGSSKSAALQLISGSDFALIHCVKDEKSLMHILTELRDFMFTDSSAAAAGASAVSAPSSSTSGTLRSPTGGVSGGGAMAFAVGESSTASALYSPFSPQAVHARTLADVKLPQLLSNPFTLELVKDVLNKALSPENGAVWLDIQRYRSLETVAARKAFAEEMLQLFVANGARYEVNLSSSMKESVTARISRGRFTLDLFDDVEREIYKLINTNNVGDVVGHQQLLTEAAIVLGQTDHKMRHVTPVQSQGHSVSAAQIVGYNTAGGAGAGAAAGAGAGAGAGALLGHGLGSASVQATPALASRGLQYDREKTHDRQRSVSHGGTPNLAVRGGGGGVSFGGGVGSVELSPSLHPRNVGSGGVAAPFSMAFGESVAYKYTMPERAVSPVPLPISPAGGAIAASGPPSRQMSRRASLDDETVAAADAMVVQLQRANPTPHISPDMSPTHAAAGGQGATHTRGRSSPQPRGPTVSKEEIAREARRFMLEDEVDRLVNPGREVMNLVNPGRETMSLVNPGQGKHAHTGSTGAGGAPKHAGPGSRPGSRPRSAATPPQVAIHKTSASVDAAAAPVANVLAVTESVSQPTMTVEVHAPSSDTPTELFHINTAPPS